MSHNRNHIIIEALIGTGEFDDREEAALREVGDKPTPCSAKDAQHAANILRKKLKTPAGE